MKRFLTWTIAAAAVLAVGGAAIASPGVSGQEAKGFVAHLATRLNLPEDQVTQAVKDAAKDTVDDAVANGSITSEQGDKIKARIDAGELPLRAGAGAKAGGNGNGKGNGRRAGAPGQLKAVRQVAVQAAADALGVTPAELTASIKGGKSITDIANEKQKDPAAVRSAIRVAVRQSLQAKVDDGTITAAQADTLSDKVADRAMTAHGRR